MPDDRLPVLRRDLAGVGEIDLVMEAGSRKVVLVAVFLQETVHQRNRCELVIVRADVHDLHAKTFVDREKLRAGTIDLFLFGCSLHRPVKIGLGDEVRQTDDGNPAEGRFVAVIDAVNALLPPESLQRRHHIVVKAFDPMVPLAVMTIGNDDPRPVIVANIDGLYDATVQQLADMTRTPFARSKNLARTLVAPTASDLIATLNTLAPR